jgi:hypothetical protein
MQQMSSIMWPYRQQGINGAIGIADAAAGVLLSVSANRHDVSRHHTSDPAERVRQPEWIAKQQVEHESRTQCEADGIWRSMILPGAPAGRQV